MTAGGDGTAPGDHPFALCLTHDVDRPYKRVIHGLAGALGGQPGHHLRTALPDRNPYWQFETVMAIERERGVRSAFYFLTEPALGRRPPREWLAPRTWIELLGRYDVRAPALSAVVADLVAGGWEVGLHGSLAAATDGERLRTEKDRVEAVADVAVRGGRQHRLRLERPDTWRHQRDAGLRYDSSLGAADDWGFDHGHEPLAPFDDDFLVFPLTLMEQALPDPGAEPAAARSVCDELLAEARDNGAVMTVLWHPRLFSEPDFPGYRGVYEHLLDRALAMDAWVGPPGTLHRTITGEPVEAPV